MSCYLLTAEAQRDVTAINDLIEQSGSRVAGYVMASPVVAFRKLAKQPRMGHSRVDLTSGENLCFWPVFSYLVVYHCGSTPLAIVAVLNGNRASPTCY